MNRFFAILATLLVFAACGGSHDSPPKTLGRVKVRLALNWFPEVEHGGYYEALRKGYFAEEGLEVEILPGGPGAAIMQRVASGEVDYGVENADKVLFGRAAGTAVVALFAPLQTSPHCVLVHEEAGIESLRDLRSATLAISPNAAFGAYLRSNLPLENVTVVPYSGSVAQFLTDTQFAQQGYLFSEPLVAARAGARPRAFLVADLGFNPYSSLLVTHERTLSERADIAEKLVRAARKGWNSYCDSPAGTNRLIHSLNSSLPLDVLDEGAALMVAMVRTETAVQAGVGTMEPERWDLLSAQMTVLGLIDTGVARPDDAWTPRFLGNL
jgi:NitT/TauT family transport system substrate-binding protein